MDKVIILWNKLTKLVFVMRNINCKNKNESLIIQISDYIKFVSLL